MDQDAGSLRYACVQRKPVGNACNFDPLAHSPAACNGAVSSPIVEIGSLTRRFGAFTAVGSLTMTANAGEVFGLLGSNCIRARGISPIGRK
jgi:hypothetical protein